MRTGELCVAGVGIMFAVLCVQMHRRDQRVREVRALVPATTEP